MERREETRLRPPSQRLSQNLAAHSEQERRGTGMKTSEWMNEWTVLLLLLPLFATVMIMNYDPLFLSSCPSLTHLPFPPLLVRERVIVCPNKQNSERTLFVLSTHESERGKRGQRVSEWKCSVGGKKNLIYSEVEKCPTSRREEDSFLSEQNSLWTEGQRKRDEKIQGKVLHSLSIP